MNTNITELASHMRGLAEAATPGQWNIATDSGWNCYHDSGGTSCYQGIEDCNGGIVALAAAHTDDAGSIADIHHAMRRNLAYIADANPANVITILDALEAAQAEQLTDKALVSATLKQSEALLVEHKAALARLAEIEKQEPVGFVHSGELQMIDLGYAHIYPKQAQGAQHPLYAAAGASPVQPALERVLLDTALLIKERPEVKATFLEMWGVQPSQDADPNAPWLSDAHMLCADQGIAPGHITDRIRALRDKLEQPAQQFTWADVGRLIGATDQARAAGLVVGTSNWGAFVCKAMGVQPSQALELSDEELNYMWECALAVANPTAGDAHLKYGKGIIAAINAKKG